MAKSTLSPGEFAIETRTAFKMQPTGPIIKVNDNGVLSITLNYALDPAHLQVNSGNTVIDINTTFLEAGIFDKNTDIHFNDLSSLPVKFTLDYDAGNDIIWLESDNAGYNLTTDAEKGRQGDV